ncbi:YchJ family protein [Glaciimonas sp. GG7]
MKSTIKATLCPCGGGQFSSCCGRFIDSAAIPQTAQELMRSRYTAFTLRDDAYLRATWHHSKRPAALDITANDDGMKWLGLDVRQHQTSGNTATVEFVARYKIAGRAQRLHELSQFVRESTEGSLRWFYVDGISPEKK